MRNCFYAVLLFAIVSCEKQESEAIDSTFFFYGSYAAIGDSVSNGKGSLENKSWTDIVKDSLRVDDYNNYSICGAVASSRYPDSTYALCSQIEKIDSDFDLITVMIGINDCILGKEICDINEVINIPLDQLDYRKSFTHGFVYDLRLLMSQHPDSQIIVIEPPAIAIKNNLDDYIRVEKTVSQRLGLPFIELSGCEYSPVGSFICSDRIHPTDLGYSVLADYILMRMKNGVLKQIHKND